MLDKNINMFKDELEKTKEIIQTLEELQRTIYKVGGDITITSLCEDNLLKVIDNCIRNGINIKFEIVKDKKD